MKKIESSGVYIKLTEYFFKFVNTDVDYQIALTLIKKINDFPDIMIEEIVFLAHTTAPSVTKFCKKLGYNSFKEMRTDLGTYGNSTIIQQGVGTAEENIQTFLTNDHLFQKEAFANFERVQFRRIAEKMKTAKMVACLTNHYGFPISNLLRELLAPWGITVLEVNRQTKIEIVEHILADIDILLLISLTAKTAFKYQELTIEKDLDAVYHILLTREYNGKIAPLRGTFDEILTFEKTPFFFESNYYSQRIMMNAIIYLVFLMSE